MTRIILGLALLITLPAASAVLACYNTPCEQEDSTNCYWDARVQGNGRGTSSLRLLLWTGQELTITYIGDDND